MMKHLAEITNNDYNFIVTTEYETHLVTLDNSLKTLQLKIPEGTLMRLIINLNPARFISLNNGDHKIIEGMYLQVSFQDLILRRIHILNISTSSKN